MNDIRALVELLCSSQLRVATGIWLIPNNFLGCIEDEAHRLDLEPIDLRQRLLDVMEPGTRFANLSSDRILNLVDAITQERGDGAGALIYNIDLLISRLNTEERNIFWQDLYMALPHRRRGVLITLPDTAANLLPSDEQLNQWRVENRLIGTIREQ